MAKTAKRKYTLPQILLLAVLLIATALYRGHSGILRRGLCGHQRQSALLYGGGRHDRIL